MRFRYLEHTADVKFQSFGKTLEEAFTNALYAAFSVMYDTSKIKPVKEKQVSVSARRPESLLYDFFQEFLFFLDTEGFFPGMVSDMVIAEENGVFSLKCTVLGDTYRNYEMIGHIKSATYNDMFIKEENGQYIIQAVMDI